MRVSGGHLCEAEAPTEPAGETQSGCGNPFSFEGNTDSFTLRVQNDRNLVIAKVRVSGGHLCGAEAPTEPAGETQNGCGNPFPLKEGKFNLLPMHLERQNRTNIYMLKNA